MTQLASVYSQFKRDTLPFSFFLFAVLLFTLAGISIYLHRSFDQTIFEVLFPQGRVEFIVMAASASVIFGYVFSMGLQIYQQARRHRRYHSHFGAFQSRLEQTLMGMLLTSEQMEEIDGKTCYEQMIENIEMAPYQDDCLRSVNEAQQHSLQLRLNMVHQFQLHQMMMQGLAAQLNQLEQCCGNAESVMGEQVGELKQLLAAFDGQLYLNTHQEKWAKLFNAYQPLCRFLANNN